MQTMINIQDGRMVSTLGFIPDRSAEFADRLGAQVEQKALEVRELEEAAKAHEEQVRQIEADCREQVDRAAGENSSTISLQVKGEIASLRERAAEEKEQLEQAANVKMAEYEKGLAGRVARDVKARVDALKVEMEDNSRKVLEKKEKDLVDKLEKVFATRVEKAAEEAFETKKQELEATLQQRVESDLAEKRKKLEEGISSRVDEQASKKLAELKSEQDASFDQRIDAANKAFADKKFTAVKEALEKEILSKSDAL